MLGTALCSFIKYQRKCRFLKFPQLHLCGCGWLNLSRPQYAHMIRSPLSAHFLAVGEPTGSVPNIPFKVRSFQSPDCLTAAALTPALELSPAMRSMLSKMPFSASAIQTPFAGFQRQFFFALYVQQPNRIKTANQFIYEFSRYHLILSSNPTMHMTARQLRCRSSGDL